MHPYCHHRNAQYLLIYEVLRFPSTLLDSISVQKFAEQRGNYRYSGVAVTESSDSQQTPIFN